ncbi:MAG: dimethylarginine dimethylaminohydrolase family protein, partial [Thermoanaerobaculia bacterium]
MTQVAITKPVPPSINECELSHLERQPIDFGRAKQQHAEYERALEAIGFTIERLAIEADNPDSVFIEDTAVVLPEIAIITRPGAESRRGEIASTAAALRRYRSLSAIEEPATLDGGDILCIGKRIFAGVSARTNSRGIVQLRKIVEAFGYHVEPVPVTACLHLKSAVTQVSETAVLLNRAWIDIDCFRQYERIEVDPTEPAAANALFVRGHVLFPRAFPRTREVLERRGITLDTVDASELAKAE